MTPLRCVSLFSGCGGLDLGLHRAGFEIVLAEDNDAACAESHMLNFPGVPFHLGSVTDLTPQLADQLTGGRTVEVDLLAGGRPARRSPSHASIARRSPGRSMIPSAGRPSPGT